MKLGIGTSGWSYDDWVGPFYDKKKGMFTNYTKVFNTTEINSTFYRYPSDRLVRGWYRNSPPGFIMAAKLPQVITHEKWLDLGRGVEEDTWRFLDLMRPMAERMGPILVQLRPKFNYEEHVGSLESFLEVLPSNHEWAVEFRHRSWLREETYEILRRNGAAYVIVDEPLLPPEKHITTDFAYIRWHGHGTRLWYDYEYSNQELEKWLPKVKEVGEEAKRTYGYFNNHFNANAVKNAIEMLDLLGQASPLQSKVLEKIVGYREQSNVSSGILTLEDFVDEEELSVSDVLMRFTTTSRLSRAEKIRDDEIKITKSNEDSLEAQIRGYYIKIDFDQRVITHDCDDWGKGLTFKRLCKHLDKLFLYLPPGRARKILDEMWEMRDSWIFQN